MELGDVYRIGSGTHWRIIASDPSKHPNQVISFSITSCRNPRHDDPACLLNSADHLVITHDSFIGYQFARIDENRTLDNKLSSGQLQLDEAKASRALIAKILLGAAESDRTPFEVYDALEAQGILPEP